MMAMDLLHYGRLLHCMVGIIENVVLMGLPYALKVRNDRLGTECCVPLIVYVLV